MSFASQVKALELDMLNREEVKEELEEKLERMEEIYNELMQDEKYQKYTALNKWYRETIIEQNRRINDAINFLSVIKLTTSPNNFEKVCDKAVEILRGSDKK